jgi:cob(I)alamin adenosyltransferase
MSRVRRAGRVLIFGGDGKGKTSAALGVALRAAGHGLHTLLVQFIKREATGEHAALHLLRGFVTARLTGTGYVHRHGAEGRGSARRAAQEALAQAAEDLRSGRYDVVVLDEVLYAVRLGLLDEAAVAGAVAGRGPGVHVVLTGDGPIGRFVQLADTVTRMCDVRHGCSAGRPPTPGIEF